MSPGFMAFTAADARSPMQSSANATGRSRTAAIAGANGLSDCAGSGAMDAYYKDYAKDFPMVVRAAWGYTVETATQAIRLVLGGVFDAYPRLKVVLGHLGRRCRSWCGASVRRPPGREDGELPARPSAVTSTLRDAGIQPRT
jgi:hypothetical protein